MTKFEKDFSKYLWSMFDPESKEYFPSSFSRLPDSMKWGIYVDFFDGVGIDILIISWGHVRSTDGFDYEHDGTYSFFIHSNSGDYDACDLKPRSQARKAALEKAIEIYNNQ